VEVSVANLTIENLGGLGCVGWPSAGTNDVQDTTSPSITTAGLLFGAPRRAVHLERASATAELLDESWWSDAAADAAPLTAAPTHTVEWTIANPTEALPPVFRTKSSGLSFAQRLVKAEIIMPMRTWDESTPDSVALAPRLGCLQWRLRTVLDASDRGFVAVSSEVHMLGACPGAARPQGYSNSPTMTAA